MLYLYDEAIQKDLAQCINPDADMNSIVKVMDSAGVFGLISQMQEDRVTFPLICLFRNEDTPIDTTRTNFTAMKKGFPSVIETETQMLYLERCLPIKLSYTMKILATNTADSDELLRELLFRYLSTYFITMQLPYESDRTIRFGVTIDTDSIRKESGNLEYITEGSLYETSFVLNCEGAVLLNYVPKHKVRFVADGVVAKDTPNL